MWNLYILHDTHNILHKVVYSPQLRPSSIGQSLGFAPKSAV